MDHNINLLDWFIHPEHWKFGMTTHARRLSLRVVVLPVLVQI